MASRRIEFFRTIRGVEVQVFAASFDGDPSVGINLGPEEVWAETLDGELEELGIAATERYLDED
jgi:hypothetical protein